MISFAACNLRTGAMLAESDDVVLPAFSTIKVLLACAFWNAVARGELEETRTYAFQPWQSVGGAGVLRGFRHAARLTLADCVHLSLAVSDNDATNIVLAFVGVEAVDRLAEELGLAGTTMQRAMMDAEARDAGRDNLTCARDLCALMAALAEGRALSDSVRGPVLRSLELSEHLGGIARALPAGAIYAGKSGDDAPDGRFTHDCAVLRLGADTIALAIMTDGGEGYEGVTSTTRRLVSELL